MSKIGLTDKTWNPVIGCSPVSDGCRNCYAERLAVRLANMGRDEYEGLTNGDLRKPRWTGDVRVMANRLREPDKWRKPMFVFVNSMSDLLHEALTSVQIGRIVKVMEETPRNIYQVLTKRPERLAELHEAGFRWPDNVWLGVSVEDQKSADARVPLLLGRRYATVQWVSYEPALGPVDWTRWAGDLDWVVIGGESGPGSRPFDLDWARDAISTFAAHDTPVFVKQLGTKWAGGGRKGKHPEKWPEELRVQAYPGTRVPGREVNEAQVGPKLKSDQRLMSACVREAAHAVVARLFRFAVDRITVDGAPDGPPPVRFRHGDTARALDIGTVYAAGSAATARYSETSTAIELLNGGYWELDELRVVLPDPDEQLEAIGRADLLVRSYWSSIRALARELRKRGTMTTADVYTWAAEVHRAAQVGQ